VPTDQKLLRDFVTLGQEILKCDWRQHYGSDFGRVAPSPPGIAYAQPGFVADDYRGVVLVGQNPGVGDTPDRARAHRVWDKHLEPWATGGGVEDYRAVLALWLRDLSNWAVWHQWCAPLLQRSGLTVQNIGYLNIVKNQTTKNGAPTARMYEADWRWTQRQLEVLQPRIVIAGGKAVGDVINRYWRNAPFEVVVQNRIRSQNSEARTRQARGISERIVEALR